jgi:hypothetical protein
MVGMKLGEQIRGQFLGNFGVLGTIGFGLAVLGMLGISAETMFWRYLCFAGMAMMLVGEWLAGRRNARRPDSP